MTGDNIPLSSFGLFGLYHLNKSSMYKVEELGHQSKGWVIMVGGGSSRLG